MAGGRSKDFKAWGRGELFNIKILDFVNLS